MTLVVSPLVALMEDQLRHLPPSLPGAVLHSMQTPDQAAATLDALRAGRLKVLFVAPERLLSRRFIALAQELPTEARFSFACIDECHCISEWSHNFRPAYYRLGHLLRQELGITQVLALTATATRRTEAAVASVLSISDGDVLRNACVRQNLRLTVSRESRDRDRSLLELLRPGGRLGRAKSVIAYCTYKGEADRLAQFLFTNGILALSYHAGKKPEERRRAQTLFLANKVRVIAATVAFGMGLDKPDVAAVVNFGLPHSIEAFVQQARVVVSLPARTSSETALQVGRAGRDGSVALCHSFVDDEEFVRLRSLTFSDAVDTSHLRRLIEHIFPDDAAEGASGCVVVQTMCQELDLRQEVGPDAALHWIELSTAPRPGRCWRRCFPTCSLRTACRAWHRSSAPSLTCARHSTSPFIAAAQRTSLSACRWWQSCWSWPNTEPGATWSASPRSPLSWASLFRIYKRRYESCQPLARCRSRCTTWRWPTQCGSSASASRTLTPSPDSTPA